MRIQGSPSPVPVATVPAQRPTRSLLQEVVLRLTVWAAPLVLIVVAGGYSWEYERAEREVLRTLTASLVQQVERESAILRLAEDNAAALAARMRDLYADPAVLPPAESNRAFDALFFRDGDGATRLRPALFEGTPAPDGLTQSGDSGFVGADVTQFSDELKRRLVLGYRLVARYGPAWVTRFGNLHLTFPENALIIHWPREPWGLKARADLRMQDFETLKSTLVAHNPGRDAVWTPLYFDRTAGAWTVTYQLPVDHDGRHLANASFDILLTDLMDRLIRNRLEGAVNLVITGGGMLIAGKDLLETVEADWGNVPIAKLGNPQIDWIHRRIQEGALDIAGLDGALDGDVRILSDAARDAWVVVTTIDGPGWAYAAIYPKSLVADQAHRAASAVLVVSLLSIGLLTVVVYGVLRSRVARPIAALDRACRSLAAGDYDDVAEGRLPLPLTDGSEIGVLARAFRQMTLHVRSASLELEAQVATRTRALEAANARLSELSLVDGLTGAFNRRAFDQDMALAFARAKAGGPPVSLLLCDVDHFKRYNDIYGHDAGDDVLRAVVGAFTASLRTGDRVYRYGGEEIAVLLDHVDAQSARPIAHRIVRAAQDLAIRHEGSSHQIVTVSGGLAGTDPSMDAYQDLIRLADARLYRSKQLGRNTLTV